VVRNFGGEQVVGDPPTSKFDDPNTVAAYQYIYDAIWKHKVMPNPEEMQVLGGGSWQAFASGKVGLVYALNDASNSVANAVGKRFKISAAPTPRGKAEKRAQFVGGSAFSIPKGSPHPDVAYELTRWVLANPENLPKIGSMAEGGTFVPRTDFWEHGLPPESTGISRDAFKKAFYDLGLRDGVYPNYFVGFLQWDPQVFNKNMSLLWAGQEKDVAKIMATVQKETVDLLKAQPQ
ncbi:MAG TPA: extracellular solute-binding protein, partial [Chloroflexota bacterium]